MSATTSTAPFSPLHKESSLSTIAKSEGSLDGKIVVKDYRPLFIALAILGFLSLVVVAGTGAAALGSRLGVWSAGLSQLSQKDAIIMIALGGGAGLLLMFGGMMGLKTHTTSTTSENNNKTVKQGSLPKIKTVEDAEAKLEEKSFTWFLQPDGKYTFIAKHARQGKKEPAISKVADILMTDYDTQQSQEDLYSTYRFIPTSPVALIPLSNKLEYTDEELTRHLIWGRDLFTFVLQRDGNYALVKRAEDGKGVTKCFGYKSQYLQDEIQQYWDKGFTIVYTSKLPAGVGT